MRLALLTCPGQLPPTPVLGRGCAFTWIVQEACQSGSGGRLARSWPTWSLEAGIGDAQVPVAGERAGPRIRLAGSRVATPVHASASAVAAASCVMWRGRQAELLGIPADALAVRRQALALRELARGQAVAAPVSPVGHHRAGPALVAGRDGLLCCASLALQVSPSLGLGT